MIKNKQRYRIQNFYLTNPVKFIGSDYLFEDLHVKIVEK